MDVGDLLQSAAQHSPSAKLLGLGTVVAGALGAVVQFLFWLV